MIVGVKRKQRGIKGKDEEIEKAYG